MVFTQSNKTHSQNNTFAVVTSFSINLTAHNISPKTSTKTSKKYPDGEFGLLLQNNQDLGQRMNQQTGKTGIRLERSELGHVYVQVNDFIPA